jgi:hypothetical protein
VSGALVSTTMKTAKKHLKTRLNRFAENHVFSSFFVQSEKNHRLHTKTMYNLTHALIAVHDT